MHHQRLQTVFVLSTTLLLFSCLRAGKPKQCHAADLKYDGAPLHHLFSCKDSITTFSQRKGQSSKLGLGLLLNIRNLIGLILWSIYNVYNHIFEYHAMVRCYTCSLNCFFPCLLILGFLRMSNLLTPKCQLTSIKLCIFRLFPVASSDWWYICLERSAGAFSDTWVQIFEAA